MPTIDINDTVAAMAWDRPWTDQVLVTTDFYDLIPDEDLDRVFALAPVDRAVISRVDGINPGRCEPERLRAHEASHAL